MTMRVHLAHTSTRCWFESVEIHEVPRFGEIIDINGLHQVDQIVWHLGDAPEATIYVTDCGSMPEPKDDWNTNIEKAKDGTAKLLTVERDGTPFVVVGGWDAHWSGKCWVFYDHRVPSGSVPLAWKPLPAAMGA
ncbi:hypothetical protein MAL1_00221 [Bacteriophage DSS3_MAL1]|nr:hypothetical protein MAL1_00221 [Bacteriophage DSS3_MAL1]